MYDTADYIANNYGTCDLDTDCYHAPEGCRNTGWRGRDCPHWKPVKARSWDELAREQKG